MKITNTTQATSPTTGGLTVSGGVGITGDLFQQAGSDLVMEIGPEYYSNSNAASVNSENNSTSGWTNKGLTLSESSSASSFSGSFSMHGISNSNTDIMHYAFPTVAGKIYQVSLQVRSNNGIISRVAVGSNINNSSLVTLGDFGSSEWTLLEGSFTGTGNTVYLRVFESSPSNNSDFFFDNVHIMQIGSANLGNAQISERFDHNGDAVGFFGTAPSGQYGPINAPAGGATVDVESRDAIQEILDLLAQYGLSE